MVRITDEHNSDIEKILSDVEPLKSKNKEYEDSDMVYKRRNDRASDDILKFI